MYSNALLSTLRQIQGDLEFIERPNDTLIAYSTHLNVEMAYALHLKSVPDSAHLLFASFNPPLSKYQEFLTGNLSEHFTKFYISDFDSIKNWACPADVFIDLCNILHIDFEDSPHKGYFVNLPTVLVPIFHYFLRTFVRIYNKRHNVYLLFINLFQNIKP